MKLFLQKTNIINLLLLLFSTILSLLLIEFLLSAFLSYKKDIYQITYQKVLLEYLKKNNILFDTRTKFEIYQSLKNKKSYFPSVRSSIKFDNLINLSNISNSNIIHCNETGTYDIFKSDKFGFRNDNIFWEQNNLDMVFLGDSYTAGACVKTHQNIAGNLIKNHDYNVINLGISGSGPLDQLAIFREYAKNLFPKFFILVFYEGNDFESLNLKRSQNEPLFKYLNDQNFSLNLPQKQNLVDKHLKNYISIKEKEAENSNISNNKKNKNLLSYFSLNNVLKLNTIRSLLSELLIDRFPSLVEIRLFTNNATKKKLFYKFIKILNYEVQKKNSELILVYMPSVQRYGVNYNKASSLKLNKLNYIHDTVIRILKKENISYVDLRNDIFEKDNFLNDELFPLSLPGYGHLSSKGYFEISETINKHLNQLKN